LSVNKIWDTIIFDLFEDIKVELGTPHDVHEVSDASLGPLPGTDDDALPDVEEEVMEYDVIDGDVCTPGTYIVGG
jgi:hypothetical protein